MKTVEEIRYFIEEVKADYLCFLERNAEGFPWCCGTSSQIIMSYIAQKFDRGTIQAGYHKKSKTFHVWGKVNEFLVDFTFFQFLEDEVMIAELCHYDEPYQLFHELVTRYHGDVILAEEFKNELVFVEEVPCLFMDEASKHETFGDYLNEMRRRLRIDTETEDLIDGSYDKTFEKVVSAMQKAV